MFYLVKSILFLLIAAAAAGMLTWQHFRPSAIERFCGGGGCADVLASPYATIGPVPISGIGLAFDVGLLAVLLVCVAARHGAFRRRALTVAAAALVLATSLSLALMFIQFAVVRAFCPLCTLSATAILLATVGAIMARRADDWPARPIGALILIVGLFATGTLMFFALGQSGRGDDFRVLARVDGMWITTRDLMREMPDGLEEADLRRYEIQKRWLQQRIDGMFIAAEARRRGITPEQLVDIEIDQPLAGRREEIKKWVQERRAAEGEAFNWVDAETKLLAEARQRRAGQFLEGLRYNHNVQLFLKPPGGPVLNYDPRLAQTLGPADAAIRFVVFTDFTCPYCAELESNLQKMTDRFMDVSVTYLAMPRKGNALAVDAAAAAQCAAEQGRFWLYHDKLFAERGQVEPKWEQYAADVGLDIEQFRACLAGPAARQRVAESRAAADAIGLDGVPNLFLNGRYVGGALDEEQLESLVRLERRRLAPVQ